MLEDILCENKLVTLEDTLTEVLSEMQNKLRATKLPVCGPRERAVEGKGRGAKRPNNLTAFSTL